MESNSFGEQKASHSLSKEGVSVCPKTSVLTVSTAALQGSFSGFSLLGEGVPIWSLLGLECSSCLWHFSESMGKSRRVVCLSLGISFPPNALVSPTVSHAAPAKYPPYFP